MTVLKLSCSEYEVDVVDDFMVDDDRSVGLVPSGEFVQGLEDLNDQLYGAAADVGVGHVEKSCGLSYDVEGLYVVWLITKIILKCGEIANDIKMIM